MVGVMVTGESSSGGSVSTPPGSLRSGGGSVAQTAARLLIVIDKLGLPVEPDCPVAGATKVVRSLTRLEKLDFWMRNSDYLADELMTEFEEGRLNRQLVEPEVRRMLSTDAAGFHYPMMKFKFGAYEPVDNAMSILKSVGLIAHRRGADTGDRARHDYFLLEEGERKVALLRADVPGSAWYDQQADAIAFLDESMQGSDARKRQYLQQEYKGAALGSDIPEIFGRARERAIDLNLLEPTT
jgi:hypothetical protein